MVIHPEDCIDCMACVDVCPVHAIYAEADLPPEFTKDVEFNAVQAQPAERLGRGGNHNPQGPAADGRGAQKGLGILNDVCRF